MGQKHSCECWIVLAQLGQMKQSEGFLGESHFGVIAQNSLTCRTSEGAVHL